MNNKDNKKIPQHIGIILDGNGRWAIKRGLPRIFGHREGFNNLLKIRKVAQDLGIKVLTVFAFSTENWLRPKQEVDFIMDIFYQHYTNNIDSFDNLDYNIKIIGETDKLDKRMLNMINDINNRCHKDNNEFTFIIAYNYGSRAEIVNVIKQISTSVKANKIDISEINETMVDELLYTSEEPPLDLLIRTSGEKRLSNFMLWQLAYTELYFVDCLWPDFSAKDLQHALDTYALRKRRFGKTEATDA